MKKKPQRTCIGCRKTTNKENLIRIVKTPYQTIKIDLDKKLTGRGAYICLSEDCIKKALKKRVLHLAFREDINIPDTKGFTNDIKDRLKIEIK